jgi:uncharacterized protein (DUF4415 family)
VQRRRAEFRIALARLAVTPESDIDTSDIPEVLDWSNAVRGGLYKPRKEIITIRLDADILAWFRAQADGNRGYQSAINQVLRRHIASTMRQKA